MTACPCANADCFMYGCRRNYRSTLNTYPPISHPPSQPAPSYSGLPGWEAQAMNNLAEAIRELARALEKRGEP